jgi:PIN domain nuclease of toxin-antitoxin system
LIFLLDTHILLWWLYDEPKLSKQGRSLISNPENNIFVSAVSGWEISIKKASGKLIAPDDLGMALEKNNFQALDITFAHAQLAGILPPVHDDPFDRMLVAQSKIEDLSLVTHDKKLKHYDVNIILI